MRCPRCHREAPRPAPFCAGCGAPLLLGHEEVRPLDVTLDLDRRARRPAAAPPPGDPAPAAGARTVDAAVVSAFAANAGPVHAGGLPAAERSHWDLGGAPGTAAAAPDDGQLPDPEVEALEVHVERPATWRRAAAWAVDAIPFLAAGALLGRSFVGEAAAGRPPPGAELDVLLDLLARERVIVLSVAAAVTLALAVYATVSHALAGATLGKRLLRIRVVGPDGRRPSPARSAVRSGLAVASAALLGLGFLLALFTRSGRALHDLIARTWVVKAP